MSILPKTFRTNTFVLFWIPHFSIETSNFWWKTLIIDKNSILGALALFFQIIPNFPTKARICYAISSIPNSDDRALARVGILIPHHACKATLSNHAKLSVPVCSLSTNTFLLTLIPWFSVHTKNTSFTIPIKTTWAFASICVYIPLFTTITILLYLTDKTIPKLSISTQTLIVDSIPNSISRTHDWFLTPISIPSIVDRAKTWFGFLVP